MESESENPILESQVSFQIFFADAQFNFNCLWRFYAITKQTNNTIWP